MKRIGLSSLFLLFFLSSYCQQDKSVAKVYTFAGKLVFYNCDPVEAYDIVYEIKTKLPAPMPDEEFNASFIVNYILEKVNEAEFAAKKEYDAILTSEGSSNDVAIKFKPSSDPNKRNLANIRKTGDKYIYVLCEPLYSYEVVFDITFKPSFPFSIVDQILKKANKKTAMRKKKKQYDAIIIGQESLHYAIRYK